MEPSVVRGSRSGGAAPAVDSSLHHGRDARDTADTGVVDVSVCIVSWNVKDLLRDCLNSLKAQAGDVRYETIVVDNFSKDGSAEMVRAEFPWVTLVEPGKNLGFGRANNVAYQHSRGRWVLLLNPDTVVLDRAIEKLTKFADEHPEAAAVGGRTLKKDGKSLERSCCWGSPGMWPLICKAFGLHILFKNSALFNREAMDYWQRDSVREVGVITGCCLMIRRDVYEQTGGFDDHFFMYAEETDLCWRMRERGKLVFCPSAEIIHLVGESAKKATSNRLFHIDRALLKLFRKHYGQTYMWVANFWMWMFFAVRAPLMRFAAGFRKHDPELMEKIRVYEDTRNEHWRLFRKQRRHLIDQA
ncbi:MAG TPA: glycosyltransferase family 2 protein [Tepidisphaeraceae bacterium]|nr:glycosyltransferase family 2 protein [Tepidisphaeraceae bacterium]